MALDVIGNGYDRVVVIDPTTGQPAAIGGGGGGSGSTGSVTAAGTNGTVAQAVQGINGGVPVAVSGPLTDAQLALRQGTLGQKTSAGSAPVVLASDQSAIPTTVTQRATIAEGGGTTSGTAGTATQVLAADANRKKFEFQNLGTATIVLRVNVGADTTTAVTTTPTTKRMIAVPAGQLYVTEADTLCTGLISVVSATASVPYSYLAS